LNGLLWADVPLRNYSLTHCLVFSETCLECLENVGEFGEFYFGGFVGTLSGLLLDSGPGGNP